MKLLLKYLHPSNIGSYLFTVLNYFLLVAVMYYVLGYTKEDSFLIIGVLYVVCFLIAISPIGEFILRVSTGCKKIKDQNIYNRIIPLYMEVFNEAKKECNYIKKPFKLYIKYDNSINAFAVGRNTICIHSGLLQLDDGSIKGILAHEIGHHVSRDTTFLLVIAVTNMITNFIIVICHLLIQLVSILITAFINRRRVGLILFIRTILVLPFMLLTKLWQLLCNVLVAYSSRQNEYEADEFAVTIGYGYELKHALFLLDGSKVNYSWYESLFISHPETHKRIARIDAAI